MPVTEAPLVRLSRWAKAHLDQAAAFMNRYFGPVWRVVRSPFGSIGSFYVNQIWNRLARNRAGEVTRKRAGITIALTLFVIMMTPTFMSAALYAWTKETAIIYMTDTQEIDPENDVHSARGCRKIPCSDSDAAYFRVKGSIFHEIHSLVTKRHRFFPEEVSGVIAPGINRCEVLSYGIRVKALMRGWGIYPLMLDAVCEPYNDRGEAISLPSDAG